MDITRLTRHSYRQDSQGQGRARSGLQLLGQLPLRGARAHELCGPARRRLALWVARATTGPILWIRSDWHPDRLHMAGARPEIAPARLIFVDARRAEDMLWCAEEALRSGAAPLVVADLAEPPGLTPVRRLHLAAEAGAETAGLAPMMMVLAPGDGGAPGVESRWHLAPDHGPHGPHGPARAAWRLSRRRARDAPPATWVVTRDKTGAPLVTDERTPQPA
jgi:protein ImuA